MPAPNVKNEKLVDRAKTLKRTPSRFQRPRKVGAGVRRKL